MTKHRIIRNPSGYHSKGKTPKEKVVNFASFIKQFDWTGAWRVDPETDILHLNARRGDNERIDIEWPATQWWPDVWYSLAGDSIKCRNISAAAKLAQDPPDADRMRRSAQRKRNGKSASLATGLARPGLANGTAEPELTGDELIASLTSSVPWDKDSGVRDVALALMECRNPEVTWVNTLTGVVHTAVIKTGNRNNKITETKDGKVIITFADQYGFHSVYANSVIRVVG